MPKNIWSFRTASVRDGSHSRLRRHNQGIQGARAPFRPIVLGSAAPGVAVWSNPLLIVKPDNAVGWRGEALVFTGAFGLSPHPGRAVEAGFRDFRANRFAIPSAVPSPPRAAQTLASLSEESPPGSEIEELATDLSGPSIGEAVETVSTFTPIDLTSGTEYWLVLGPANAATTGA